MSRSRYFWIITGLLAIAILGLAACQSNPAPEVVAKVVEEPTTPPTATPEPAKPAIVYRGGTHRIGAYDTQGVAELAGARWKFETGDEIWSSPVIADGVVYFGSDDDYFYAVDVESGQEIWKVQTEDDIHSSPAVADGVVYFGSWDGYLYAVDAQTGQEIWKFDTFKVAKRPYSFRPMYDDFTSSPVVVDGVVYMGSVDGSACFYAIDAQTGQEIWSFAPKLGDIVYSSPAVSGNTVYFGGNDNFYALDTQTGEEKWSFDIDGSAGYAPAIDDDGTVYFSSKDTYLYALDGQTGDEKWRNNLAGMSWVTSSPALANGLVYANTSDGRALFAVQMDTGEKKWSFKVGGYGWSSPSVAEEIVYIGGGGSRKLYAVNAQTGEEVWNFETEGAVYSTPVVADGVVYVGSLDGNLYALN